MKRRRARNFPLTVRYGRYRLTFRELVDRYGILKAAKVYRDATKRIGHGTLLMNQIGVLKKAHPRTHESRKLYKKAERILRAGLKDRLGVKRKTKKRTKKKRRTAKKVRRTKARKPKRKVKAKPKRKTPRKKAKARKTKARKARARKPKARKAKARKARAKPKKRKAAKKRVAKVRAKAVKKKAAAKKVIRGAWRSPEWPKTIKDSTVKAVSAWLKEAGGSRDNKLAVSIAGTRPKQRLKALKALLKKAPKGVSWPEALKYTMYLVESPARPGWLVSVEGMMRQAAKAGAKDKAKKYFAAAAKLRKRLGRPPTTDEIAAEIVPDWGKKAAAN